MNKSYYYGSGIIMVTALIVSMLIIPGKNEVALMQLEDGNLQAAFEKYQHEASQGDVSLDVAMPLSRLYLQYGDIDNAIRVMEHFVVKHPTSIPAIKQLGVLYKSAQRMEEYMQNLQTLGKIAPSPAIFTELLSISDFLCHAEVKKDALEQLIHSTGYKPEEADYTTLAMLYAEENQHKEAIETLKTIISLKAFQVSHDTIDLALQLLMENGYKDTAFDMASIYLEKHSNPEETARIMAIFRTEGKAEMALNLAKYFQRVAEKNPAFQEEFIASLLARGQKKEAKTALMLSMQQQSLPASLTETLLDLVIAEGDEALLETIAGRIPLDRIPEETLMQCAEMALENHNPQLAHQLKVNIGEAALAFTPVLASVLAVAENRVPEVQQSLAGLYAAELTLGERLSLARIYAMLKYYPSLLALSDRLSNSDIVENLDAEDIAAMYLLAGKTAEGIARYRVQAGTALRPLLVQKTDKIVLFLAAGSGNEALFVRQEQRLGKLDAAMLSESYALAEAYNQTAFTLTLASRLYAHHADKNSRMQFADALMRNHRYGEVLDLLDIMIKDGQEMDQPYLDAVAGLIQQHQMEQLPRHQQTLYLIVDRQLAQPTISGAEKRNIAYLLLSAGYKEKAISVFFALAKQQAPDSEDVQQLLFLAGNHPGNRIRDWLQKRASEAEAKEQTAWLGILYDRGDIKAVIATIESQPEHLQLSKIADIYIDALIQTRSRKKLAVVLEAELEKGTSRERYRKLTQLAAEEGFDDLAVKHLRKLVVIAPYDSNILKHLGLYSFYKEHYSDAEHYLARYLSQQEGDHEILYAYGESLWEKQNYDQGRLYFQRAEEAIKALREKDFVTRTQYAHILYRLGKVKEAATEYRALLREQPGNNALKSDFATMLIEKRQFTEADQLLAE